MYDVNGADEPKIYDDRVSSVNGVEKPREFRVAGIMNFSVKFVIPASKTSFGSSGRNVKRILSHAYVCTRFVRRSNVLHFPATTFVGNGRESFTSRLLLRKTKSRLYSSKKCKYKIL